MASIKKQLEDIKKKGDKFLDSESDRINADFRVYLTDSLGRITQLLGETAGGSKFDAAKADQLIKDVDAAILQGRAEVIGEFQQSFLNVGKDSLTYFAALDKNASFEGIDKDTLNLLVRQRVEDFDARIEQALVTPMRSKIIESTIGGKSITESVQEIRAFINDEQLLRKDGKLYTDFNTETLVADSHRAFHAILREEKAQSIGLEIRRYQGPLDSITRKACQTMLQEAPHGAPGLYLAEEVTVDFMNQLINKRFKAKPYELLSVNPLVGRGGFNCRHDFFPISLDMAKELGFNE